MTEEQQAFWNACMSIRLKDVKKFLEDESFNVNITNDENKRLFNVICEKAIHNNSYLLVFKLLVKRPSLNVNFTNVLNQLPLISACEKMMNVDLPQSTVMLTHLLARPDIDPNRLCPIVDEDILNDDPNYYKRKHVLPVQYMTPYYYACIMDNYDEKKCSKKLLKHANFDLNAVASIDCEMSGELCDNFDMDPYQTNMFVACDSGNLHEILYMLDNGIIPDKADIDTLWETIMWMSCDDEEPDVEFAQEVYNRALQTYLESKSSKQK